MHSRISPTAMASMHCVKPWALYDKIKIKPAWGLSSTSKQIVVCSLKGQKKEQTGSTTESIRKDRCTTINNCWLSVLPTFLDLFIPKVFESTQLNWKSYISLESVPDFVICFYSLFFKHQSQHLYFVLLCVVEVGDALRVMLLPYLLLLDCKLLRLVWCWQEVDEGRHAICRNDQAWKQQERSFSTSFHTRSSSLTLQADLTPSFNSCNA